MEERRPFPDGVFCVKPPGNSLTYVSVYSRLRVACVVET